MGRELGERKEIINKEERRKGGYTESRAFSHTGIQKLSNPRTLHHSPPDHLVTTAIDALLRSGYQAKPLELFLIL